MPKLILSMDGLVLKEIPISKERMTIGRKPHNDIQIDNLAMSGEHAVIVTILNDSFLEDLNSTNGTMVNGVPIKKHFLQHNDVIELGKYKLKYINEAPTAAAPADFEKTMVLRPQAMQKAMPPPAAPAPSPSPAPAPAARAVTDTQIGMARPAAPAPQPAAPAVAAPAAMPLGAIQVLSGRSAGREIELTKTLLTLGKPGVQTAVITRRPQGYFITHVEGSNFPVVNGNTLDTQPHPLGDHDVIEIAGTKMEFFLKG
jgi:pSer/pThr/pTyr-binding forkhead associated (FHA) protein